MGDKCKRAQSTGTGDEAVFPEQKLVIPNEAGVHNALGGA